MAMKNTVEVVIAGKVFKISGFESAEYLHQVSVYINEKLAEFQKMEGYRRQTTDQKQLMLNMNLADDFFKAKRQADKLSAELEKKDREMYGIRHDLIEAQMDKEKLETEKKELKEKLSLQKKEAGEIGKGRGESGPPFVKNEEKRGGGKTPGSEKSRGEPGKSS